jgi:phosphate uptake regulator
MREKVQKMYAMRAEMTAEADKAFASGNKEKGFEIIKLVKELNEKIHAVEKEAADTILAHTNKGHDNDYIDLHGLHIDEAIDATK